MIIHAGNIVARALYPTMRGPVLSVSVSPPPPPADGAREPVRGKVQACGH
jgi:hypothetical protein